MGGRVNVVSSEATGASSGNFLDLLAQENAP